MAHFFALLLAVFQAPPAPAAPPVSLDARWVATFETPPAAPPGFDATTAYRAAQAAVSSSRSISIAARSAGGWTSRRAFTPATGEGLVFTVTEQMIEARDAATGATKWQTPLPGGAAAPLYWDTGWLLASTTAGDLAAFRASDGTLVWRRQLGAPLVSAPGPALDRLFLPLADNRLVALLLATGETVWERKLSGADHGAARARGSTRVRHDGEGSDERRSVARPRAMDVEARRRHGRQSLPPTTSASTSRRATTSCAPSIARAAT